MADTEPQSKWRCVRWLGRHSSHTRWTLVSWILVAIGSIVQIGYISEQYFAYETVSEVSIGKETQIVPPKMIMCMEAEAAARNATEYERIISSYSDEMTVGAILDNSYDIEELIQYYYVHDADSYTFRKYYYIGSLLKSKKFLKRNSVCYSFYLDASVKFPEHYLTNGLQMPRIFAVKMRADFLANSTFDIFYMHPSNLDFHGKSNRFGENNRFVTNKTTGEGNNNWVIFTYSRITRKYLGPPYTTNCLDYTEKGFQSRGHCFESCLTKASIRELNFVPFSVSSYESLNVTLMDVTHNNDDIVMDKLRKLERDCSERCKQKDCFKMEYTPKLISTIKDTNSVVVELYSPNEPGIQSVSKPKITLIDYVTYVLSCLGFWFAFSPLVFMEQKLLTRLTRSRKKDNENVSAAEMEPLSAV
ncbi:hypothetical protein HDE_03047 [Halotydeus destructor]|nr:hypothetical protein HDE_03047 [Halotydeus destructor]